MKLYTEEQVKSAFRIGKRENYFNEQEADEFADTAIKYFKPIELPSDEDIEKETWGFRLGRNVAGFISGAKWMKEQILNQNK